MDSLQSAHYQTFFALPKRLTLSKTYNDRLRENFGQINDLRILKVTGDSMRPTIFDGDLVMINVNRTLESDGIYVLRYGDELFIKRVMFEETRIRLISDHPGFPGYDLNRNDESDMSQMNLIGRVIWTGRAL